MNEEIPTPRLLLRKLTLEDAPGMYQYGRHKELTRYVTWSPHTSVENSYEILRDVLIPMWDTGKDFVYGVILKESEEFIGTVGFHRKQNHSAVVGYGISMNQWGNGFATEALKALIKEGFQDKNLWRITAICDVENIGSARVMEKAGMEFEGVLRKYAILQNRSDIPRDMKCYAITKESKDE